MPSPSLISDTALQAEASGATTQTVTLPTHQAKDYLVVVGANNGGQTLVGAPGAAAPPLEPIGIISGDANFNLAVYGFRAPVAGTAGPVFTHGGASSATIGHYATAYLFRGTRDSGSPVEAKIVAGPTNNTRPKHGPLTSVTPAGLYVALAGVDDDNAWSAGFRTGYTGDQQTSTVGGDYSISRIHKALAAPQTVNQDDFVDTPFTMTSADPWISVAFILASVEERWGVAA